MRALHCLPIALLLSAATLQAQSPSNPKPFYLPIRTHLPEGLTPLDWAGIHAAHEAGRYDVTPSSDGWYARNPRQQWATAFDGRVSPIMEKVLNNLHESKTLTALRDTLLPKLISGELRINDAAPVRKEAVG